MCRAIWYSLKDEQSRDNCAYFCVVQTRVGSGIGSFEGVVIRSEFLWCHGVSFRSAFCVFPSFYGIVLEVWKFKVGFDFCIRKPSFAGFLLRVFVFKSYL